MTEIWRKKISPFPWSELSDFWSIIGGLLRLRLLILTDEETRLLFTRKSICCYRCATFFVFRNPFLVQKTAMCFSCPSKNQAANCLFYWTDYSPVILLMLPPGSMHSGLQKGSTRDVSHQGSLVSDLHQSLFDTSCSILFSYILLEYVAQWTDVPPTVLWDCFKWIFSEQVFSYLHFIFSSFYGLTSFLVIWASSGQYSMPEYIDV